MTKTKVPSKKPEELLAEVEKKLAEYKELLDKPKELTADQKMKESDAEMYRLALMATITRKVYYIG